MKIVIKTISGDWDDAADWINRWDLANAVVSISPMVGEQTNVALRLRDDMWAYLKSVGAL